MIRKSLALSLLFICLNSIAQEVILKPDFINYPMDSITKDQIMNRLDLLFAQIEDGEIKNDLLTNKNKELTKSALKELINYESKEENEIPKKLNKQLINIYPISNNEYSLSISYGEQSEKGLTSISYIVRLIANNANKETTFSIPLDYLTRRWKSEKIGNITYYFSSRINKERAKVFDEKNTKIANRLGLEPEKLDFYMCSNYQEILKLLGFEYALESNGQYRDGYGVDANTIFSVMNNEDFSHDMFHYYSGKVNERNHRNWITEEGIAYSWGNAYYTDKEGNMVTHNRLISELKDYLSKNPNCNLFELFSKNKKIFGHLAPEISTRSTIAGLIANEVEKKKGMEGILKLINCGRKKLLENFLSTTDDLIGINEANFNKKVKNLLKAY